MAETEHSRPEASISTFDWRVFADATCAGLTPLIPLPFVDLVFEGYFRRRMPRVIAYRLQLRPDPEVQKEFGKKPLDISLRQGCLWIPLRVLKYVLRKIWRKVIYILAIADAVDQVGYYWHRAYLTQHILKTQCPESPSQGTLVFEVFHQVLKEADTSPIKGVARQVVRSVHRVFLLLVRARKRGSVQTLAAQEAIFKADWPGIEKTLRTVVVRFQSLYLERVQSKENGSSDQGG